MQPTDASREAGDPDDGAPTGCDPAISGANRDLVALALRELFVEKDISAVDRYWADPYLQHNPIARSGVAAFRSIMGSVVASPSFRYEPLLTLGDCDLVVALGRYSQTGVIFDMFRVSDERLVEHWDSDANQASSVSQFGALDEAAATAESRALFTQLSSVVLVAGDTGRASEFFGPSYVEHHGAGANGPEAFVDFLRAESVSYDKVHHIIADGNYVFAISEGARGSAPFAFYDLFRVEGGKLAEHWDSRRAVPSSTTSGLPIF